MATSTARPPERRGLWKSLTRSQAQVEADELQDELAGEQLDADDLLAICNCTGGDEVAIRGMVRSISVPPPDAVPSLEIDLYDGSGSVRVVWLGRRSIPGIEPGRTMVVHGRLTSNEDNPTMYNPRYELKPSAG